MRQAKRPAKEQKKFLKTKGLDPESWLVVRDTQEYLEVVSRKELAACEMRRIEGVRKKPRTRKLAKALMALLAAGVLSVTQKINVQAVSAEDVVAMSERIGTLYSLCPELLQAIAWHESSYREDAENDGCSGLMQVAGRWHGDRMARLQVTDLYDPESNMLVAADYLAELFAQYEDLGMVLMVYSGDSGAEAFARSGQGLSEYAQEIMEHTYQLEQQHGK